MLNIVIPMAGKGSRFQEAGYAFPKPIIDINGKTMIEVVVRNLKPQVPHRFIFICHREHYEKYDLYNILKNVTDNNFEIVLISGMTAGAACTVLTALQHIDSDDDLLIANSDQYLEVNIDDFIAEGKKDHVDGLIMSFNSSHPKWSFVRTNDSGKAVEVAEKRVISNNATAGVYYFSKGSDFVRSAQAMIEKDIRHNNEFYVCPVYNEMILSGKNVYPHHIAAEKMHGLGTPEELNSFLDKLRQNILSI